MTLPFHRMPDPFGPIKKERRTHGRRLQEALHCSFGIVLDVSRGGMRVLSRRRVRVDKTVTVVIDDLEHGDATIELDAVIVWSKRLGFRRHELGLRFGEIDDETARKLADVATRHRLNYGCAG